ncbi:cytochrome-ba3 oxidase subunit [Halopiger thermotolerans]
MASTLESVTPRHAAAVGLFAIVPLVVYGVTHSAVAGLVSAINLALIYGSLYVAMTPVDGDHGHGHGGGRDQSGNGVAN